MGVSLSLEAPREERTRRRGGQHTRTAEEQACLDALAAYIRSDPETATRGLSRVSVASLSRLVVASRALAQAAQSMLDGDPAAANPAERDFVISPVCLLGLCRGVPSVSQCRSPSCQHDCHAAPAGR
ncbi:MAG TPA: hypothetical protein VGI58_07815 [Streptosporangiaceae bacterium]